MPTPYPWELEKRKIASSTGIVPAPGKTVALPGKPSAFMLPGGTGKPGVLGATNDSVFGRPVGVEAGPGVGGPTSGPSTSLETVGTIPEFQVNSGSIFGASTTPGGKSTYHDPDDGGMSNALRDAAQKIIAGGTRFSPEVMEGIKARLRATTDATAERTKAGIGEDFQRLGGRQGLEASEMAGAERQAGADYTAGVRDLEIQKAVQDFDDQLEGIDRGQKWLDQLRSYSLSKDSNQIERDRLAATLALGYAKIAEDRNRLEFEKWSTLLGREPLEGRDYTWTIGPDGQRKRVWYRDLEYGQKSGMLPGGS